MKLTNGELYAMNEPLGRLLKIKLPAVISYKLAKIAHLIGEQMRPVEEVRSKLVDEYRGDEPGMTPGNPKFMEFLQEYQPLMAQEFELNADVVKLPSNIEIEAEVLLALTKIVEVE